jgi:hypothetical protein
VYFDEHEPPERLTTLFEVLGIQSHRRDYTVVWTESDDPERDGFVTCLRVIGRGGVAQLDKAAAAGLPDQALEAGELLKRFVAEHVDRFGPFGPESLGGVLGGDGDWAYERLSFGMMMENEYWQAYRIWGRAWLVLK